MVLGCVHGSSWSPFLWVGCVRWVRLRLPGGGYLFAELLLAGAVGVHDPELVSPFVVGDSGAVG